MDWEITGIPGLTTGISGQSTGIPGFHALLTRIPTDWDNYPDYGGNDGNIKGR